MALDDLNLDPTAPAWAKAGGLSQQRYEKLVYGAVGSTVLVLVVGIAWLRIPGPWTTVFMAITAVVASGVWTALVWSNTGGRKELRLSYQRWLMTTAGVEAYREAVRAYFSVARELQSGGSNQGLTVMDDLWKKAVRSLPAGMIHEEMREYAAWLSNCGRAQRELQIVHGATERALLSARRSKSLAETLAKEAEAKCADARRVMVYAEGNVPATSLELEPTVLQRHVADAFTSAAIGHRVYESPTVGAMLGDTARWSALAAPFKLTRELMELFDPANAVAVPGASPAEAPPSVDETATSPTETAASGTPPPGCSSPRA